MARPTRSLPSDRGEVVDPARYYFRTLPRFETSAEAYAFLNRIVAVGVGEARPDGAVHRIDEMLSLLVSGADSNRRLGQEDSHEYRG